MCGQFGEGATGVYATIERSTMYLTNIKSIDINVERRPMRTYDATSTVFKAAFGLFNVFFPEKNLLRVNLERPSATVCVEEFW